MENDSLKKKTIKGVGWSAADNVSRYGVQFAVGIVLARLLSPDDYGLLGLVTVFTTICTAFINGGFNSALIRTKDATEEDYNTSFIVNLLLSLFFYAVLFVCAPLIADFFGRTELTDLVRVSMTGIIIGALSMVQQTRLTKRIDFKTQTKITLISSIASGFLGIGLAFLGFGVWALVAQQLCSQIVITTLLYFYNRWMPRLSFSHESFHRLFGFGWKIMASNLISTVWRDFYQMVIGKCYAPAALGQYTRAKHFSNMLSNNLVNIIQRVTYPVLSSIQDDNQRLLSAYRRIIRTSTFVTSISTFSLAAVSEPLIYCLIGPKWHDAAVYLPFLCAIGLLYPLIAINMNLLAVQGRSNVLLKIEIVKKATELLPLLIGIFVGIIPMLCASILTGIIGYLLNAYYAGQRIGYTIQEQLLDTAPSYGVGLAIVIPVSLLLFLPLSYWVILPIQIIVGAITFFLVCHISKINEYEEIKAIAMSRLRKR